MKSDRTGFNWANLRIWDITQTGHSDKIHVRLEYMGHVYGLYVSRLSTITDPYQVEFDGPYTGMLSQSERARMGQVARIIAENW